MSCPGCKKELLTENGSMVVEALGRKYHADCFKCSKCRVTIKGSFGEHNGVVVCKSCIGVTCAGCQATISSGGYVEIRGKAYHEGCVPSGGVGGGSGCATCGGELDGECVSTDGLSYHARCFVCATCKQPLKSQFFTFEGKTYCKLCRVTARMDKQAATGEKINAREANRDNQKILGSKIRKADGSFATAPASTSPPPEAKPAYIPAHAKNNPMPSSSSSPAASSPSYGGGQSAGGGGSYAGSGGGGGYAGSGGAKPSSATVGASAISAAPANASAGGGGGSAGGNPAFCPECGTKSIVGRAFCGECGHKFGTPPVEKVELPSNYEDLQRRFAALKTEDD